jgi:uncharacterized protein YfaS (alpha-2-macroglobulin family)
MILRVRAILPFVMVFATLIGMPFVRASPALGISVQTNKSYYSTNDSIGIYGLVLSSGAPLSGVVVALEVHDPASGLVAVRTLQTNSSGTYSLVFKLSPGALTGSYNVYVSCTYGGETVFNSTSFQASALAITLTTDQKSYNVGDNITISGSLTLNSTALSGALVAIEVQNPNGATIVVRVLETDNQGMYGLTFQASAGSILGTYTAFASASHDGAIATAQTSFLLRPKTVSADINADGRVNIVDLTLAALAFGSHPGEARWDPRCDLDGNNVINIIDITLVARAWTG